MYAGLPWPLVPDEGVELSDVGTCYGEECSDEWYCSVRVGKRHVLRPATLSSGMLYCTTLIYANVPRSTVAAVVKSR